MKKNKFLFISNWVALLYIAVVFIPLVSLLGEKNMEWGSLNVVTMIALPSFSACLVTFGLNVGWKAYNNNQRWLTLFSTFLYLLGMMINMYSGLFLILNLILNGIAFVQQNKQFYKDKSSEAQLLP